MSDYHSYNRHHGRRRGPDDSSDSDDSSLASRPRSQLPPRRDEKRQNPNPNYHHHNAVVVRRSSTYGDHHVQRVPRPYSEPPLSDDEEEYDLRRDRGRPPRRRTKGGNEAGLLIASVLAFVSVLLCFGMFDRDRERRSPGKERGREDGENRR